MPERTRENSKLIKPTASAHGVCWLKNAFGDPHGGAEESEEQACCLNRKLLLLGGIAL